MNEYICQRCGRKTVGRSSEIVGEKTIYECHGCGFKKHLFEEVLNEYRKKVKNKIDKYLYTKISGVSPLTHPDIEEFHWKLCADYLRRGGKYVRPTLLILTAEAMGEKIENCLNTAAAMEVSENWLLIHDDFEDHSLSRRGAPSLHIRYTPELAVNAGDTLHIIMWKILQDNNKIIGNEKTFRIMDEFYKMLSRTALGQTAELLFVHLDKFDLTEKEVYYILDGKTSYYTIAGPMRLGAIIAENDKDKLEKKIFPILNELGTNLGRAFQITDDILDLTSEFRGLKKQVGNDIYEGKRTLLLIHLFNNATEFDRKRIFEILKKPREEKTEKEVQYIISLMKEYGSIDYAKNVAKKLALKAREIFKKIDFFVNEDARKKILLGIDFIINREF